MSSTMNNLLLHPIRLRIVSAMTGDRVTAKDLAKALPDIPQTTLYRHINVLVEGGLLEVVEEIPQRGTVERVFGFKTPPSLSPEDLRGLSKEKIQETFSLIMFTLLNEALSALNQFPDGEEVDLLGSGFQFSECQLNLSDAEYQEMNEKILEIMIAAGQNQPSEERKRRIFSFMFIPVMTGKGNCAT